MTGDVSTELRLIDTEYCLGSCAAEQARLREFSEQIVALQKKQAASHINRGAARRL